MASGKLPQHEELLRAAKSLGFKVLWLNAKNTAVTLKVGDRVAIDDVSTYGARLFLDGVRWARENT